MGHLWLIGMMGSGKTSVARELAKRRDEPFYDTDAAVEAVAGKAIVEIFAEDGEERFRLLESEAVEEIAASAEGVVATGGGVVLDARNVEVMLSSGRTVLLEADPAVLASRVASGMDRPLVAGDPASRLREIADVRARRYVNAAAAIVDADGTVEEVADRVERACAAS